MSDAFWTPDYTSYAVTDVETTVNAPEGFKFEADPRAANNKVVLGGWCGPGSTHVHHYYQMDIDRGGPHFSDVILVGHNLKFDHQYLNQPKRPQMAWDTGIAHYILTGQKAKFPSLEQVAAHYGLGKKTIPMDKLWDIGFKTEDMDPDFLKEYLDGDVLLTRAIYEKQLEATAKTPMTRLLILHCSMASLALGDAEMTGIPLHMPSFKALHDREMHVVNSMEESAKQIIRNQYGMPVTAEVELTPATIGRALHELPIVLEELEAEPRILKSGKVAKRKRVIKTEYKSSILLYTPPPIAKTASGAIKVDDDVLEYHEMAGSRLAKNIRALRTSAKLTSTYTGPALEYCNATGYQCLHTKFNQTTTNTGRTSSTAPNVQNLPPEIEACVRAPTAQYLVKADFSQLQICGLAMVSGDKQLIHDVNHNVDIHYETGKSVYRWKDPGDMEKHTRRIVKNVNFGLIFGGTAKGLSYQTGVDVPTIQRLIDAFEDRYPDAYAFGKKLHKQVEDTAKPVEGAFINGHQVREAFTMTPSGRLIRFQERESPPWLAKKGKPLSFSPNEVANYPIQGYTDGDLAVQFLALMWWNGIRIINLVHDAYWFLTDDPKGLQLQVTKLLKEFNDTLQLKVPLKLDFAVEDSDGNKIGKGS